MFLDTMLAIKNNNFKYSIEQVHDLSTDHRILTKHILTTNYMMMEIERRNFTTNLFFK